MFKTNKVVVLSVLILVCALIVLYVLFFKVKYPKLKDEIAQVVKKEYQLEMEKMASEQTPCPVIETQPIDTLNTNNDQLQDISSIEVDEDILLDDELFDIENTINILPGTIIYTGNLEIVNELGLTVNYILTDNNQIYYVNLNPDINDLEYKVQSLGGNLNHILDKEILTKNLLFGDSVTYINLPDYNKKKVNMIVRYELIGDIWLIQIDYDKYYNLKSYLQEIFSY
ncbi:MAG: hypothetical protein V3575_01670 [Candidatus Absconditabacteria bacterium]